MERIKSFLDAEASRKEQALQKLGEKYGNSIDPGYLGYQSVRVAALKEAARLDSFLGKVVAIDFFETRVKRLEEHEAHAVLEGRYVHRDYDKEMQLLLADPWWEEYKLGFNSRQYLGCKAAIRVLQEVYV